MAFQHGDEALVLHLRPEGKEETYFLPPLPYPRRNDSFSFLQGGLTRTVLRIPLREGGPKYMSFFPFRRDEYVRSPGSPEKKMKENQAEGGETKKQSEGNGKQTEGRLSPVVGCCSSLYISNNCPFPLTRLWKEGATGLSVCHCLGTNLALRQEGINYIFCRDHKIGVL